MIVAILIVIFSGIALITYVDNTTKAQRRLPPPGKAEEAQALTVPAKLLPDAVETLILHLPEPSRTRAWTLLCELADAQRQGVQGDTRTAYLLSQTRDAYLPDTLRAYLGLTEGARQALAQQGQPADTLLDEQLRLLEDSVREALRHDHATADRLLTQGRFLRERFGMTESGELVLPDAKRGELGP